MNCWLVVVICIALCSSRLRAEVSSRLKASFINPLLQTGTTIVGICCSEGVVLGADTRSTGGNLIFNKYTKKIHKISESIYCCGAGTAGDCDHLKHRAADAVALNRVDRHLAGDFSKFDSVHCVIKSLTNSLHHFKKFSYRQPDAVFILGGVDAFGPSLYQISNKGSVQRMCYASLGSGSINAMCVLEHTLSDYHSENVIETLSLDNATDIVRRAVLSGIANDLGSGSSVDLCTIRCDGSTNNWREGGSAIAIESPTIDHLISEGSLHVNTLGRLAFAGRRMSGESVVNKHQIECRTITKTDVLQCDVEFIS